jgi:hypothetical protein
MRCAILAALLAVAASTEKWEIVYFSSEYQLGKYPYIAGDEGQVPIITASVGACEKLCSDNPACKFGTMVTAGAKLTSSTHSYDNKARFGECWLSTQTHVDPEHPNRLQATKCGVACVSFRKVLAADKAAAERVTAAPIHAPTAAGPAGFANPASARHSNCHETSTGKHCSMSCHCDPFTQPSAFTQCKQDVFTGHIQTYHLTPKFHTRPFHPSTQHKCAVHKDKGCSCCSCDSVVGVHSFVGVGIGRHIVDLGGLFVPTTHIIKDGDRDFFISKGVEDCERLCSEQSYAELRFFWPIEMEPEAIEIVQSHTRLDCQARCDANVLCKYISIELANADDTAGKCAMYNEKLASKLADMAYSDNPTHADAQRITLKKQVDANDVPSCKGGTYIGNGINSGRCYLATKLMTESDCLDSRQPCRCRPNQQCTAFRRRPDQFLKIEDPFKNGDAAPYMNDCAAMAGEACFNYFGCTMGGKRCDETHLPKWFAQFKNEGEKQCCGAGLSCVSSGKKFPDPRYVCQSHRTTHGNTFDTSHHHRRLEELA